ncbi:MAG: hypothetical protein CUN52_07950 [Phototrophicales bacterium]|nr:MAG: hypothetical protein CUN52_07950 [Phototrophicales bacterium]
MASLRVGKNRHPHWQNQCGVWCQKNVWNEPPLAGKERLKNGTKAVHLNQKPLKIIRNLIQMSSDENDVIWEPFGGLFTGAVASHELKRRYFGAEIDEQIYQLGLERLQVHLSQLPLFE